MEEADEKVSCLLVTVGRIGPNEGGNMNEDYGPNGKTASFQQLKMLKIALKRSRGEPSCTRYYPPVGISTSTFGIDYHRSGSLTSSGRYGGKQRHYCYRTR